MMKNVKNGKNWKLTAQRFSKLRWFFPYVNIIAETISLEYRKKNTFSQFIENKFMQNYTFFLKKIIFSLKYDCNNRVKLLFKKKSRNTYKEKPYRFYVNRHNKNNKKKSHEKLKKILRVSRTSYKYKNYKIVCVSVWCVYLELM